ncbi:MAG: hypothetical protein IPH18_10035 [Chitinophagaceae bacterium]|nr:hypothetical protein [Chitinophagaceae bacterium]
MATYTARAAEKLRRQYSAAGFMNVFVVTNEKKEGEYEYNPKTSGTHISLPAPTSCTNELIKYAIPLMEQIYKKAQNI